MIKLCALTLSVTLGVTHLPRYSAKLRIEFTFGPDS